MWGDYTINKLPMQTNGQHLATSGYLAIKPALLQFLIVKANLDAKHPVIDLNACNTVSLYLGSLLVYKSSLEDDQRHIVPDDFTGRLYFLAKAHAARDLRIFLTPTRIVRFNAFVNEWMRETLFERVDVLTQLGAQEKGVIEAFFDEFDLHDVLNMESLKRACTRRRERLGRIPLKIRKDCSLFRKNSPANVRPTKTSYLQVMTS
jgi:hypothetical protein